jgi:deoxyribodipyrimidine photo-lyase
LGIAFSDYKDQVLLERDEVLTQQGRPYSVFTPYKRAWLQRLDAFQLKPYPVERYARHLAPPARGRAPAHAGRPGLYAHQPARAGLCPPGCAVRSNCCTTLLPRMAAYHEARDYPGRKGVSYLSVHLRFGTVSIRQLAALAAQQASEGCAGAQTWLSELAWRDFYFMILWHHPQVVTQSFKPEYDRVQWDEAPELWQAWCAGAYRLPAGRCGHAPDAADRLYAQPPAHGGGQLLDQGPGH